MDKENLQQQSTGAMSPFRSIFEWVEAMVFAMVVVVLFSACVFRVVTVDGNSMLNTLQNHDMLLMVNAFYDEAEYGDIVVIKQEGREPLIKRVIAKAGDVIKIDAYTEEVYLNGELLEEPYLSCSTPTLYEFTGPYTVPEGTVFVMGDNRHDSHDSRDLEYIGSIKEEDIMGKAVFRVMPFSNFGPIE